MKKDLLRNPVSLTYYLKGWAEGLDASEVDQSLLEEVLPFLIHDTESLEIILQKYALHETFLGNSTKAQLERLNQTLNIQWALDIAASFQKDEKNSDFSIN